MSSQIADMSSQIANPEPITITIKEESFQKMLIKDIFNTKWKLVERNQKPENAMYITLTSIEGSSQDTYVIKTDRFPSKTWKYIGPNQIQIGDSMGRTAVFFSRRHLVILDHDSIEMTGSYVE